MSRRNRIRRKARQPAKSDPKPMILVVCEGLVTEPEYLRGFKAACRNSRVNIETHGGKGVPRTLVEFAKMLKRQAEHRARRERDDNLRYDEVWCVFDVDEHPDLPEAIHTARENSIKLAISNPCFELWLWLHFAEQPGTVSRYKIINMLTVHLVHYNKHVRYADYAQGYYAAVQRARQLDPSDESRSNHDHNPSTGMWRLTESIRSGA